MGDGIADINNVDSNDGNKIGCHWKQIYQLGHTIIDRTKGAACTVQIESTYYFRKGWRPPGADGLEKRLRRTPITCKLPLVPLASPETLPKTLILKSCFSCNLAFLAPSGCLHPIKQKPPTPPISHCSWFYPPCPPYAPWSVRVQKPNKFGSILEYPRSVAQRCKGSAAMSSTSGIASGSFTKSAEIK